MSEVAKSESSNLKVCNRCFTEKEISNFSLQKGKPINQCKSCVCEKTRIYNQKNREKISEKRKKAYKNRDKQKSLEYSRHYRQKNKERIRAKMAEYGEKNKENKAAYDKEYRIKNFNHLKEITAKRTAQRLKEDNVFRFRRIVQKQIWYLIKVWQGVRGPTMFKILNALGYSKEDLIAHLEANFKEGMSWENYGKMKLGGERMWEIDHIRPVCSFNFSSLEDVEFKECWALENLRPLWADENAKKKTEDAKQSTLKKNAK